MAKKQRKKKKKKKSKKEKQISKIKHNILPYLCIATAQGHGFTSSRGQHGKEAEEEEEEEEEE